MRLHLATYLAQSRQMHTILPYGTDSSVHLEPKTGTLVAECGEPHAASLDDPGAATTRALDDLLAYPPLEQCLTPGDRVVLPLDRGIQRAGEVVAAVVGSLLKAGVQPDGLTLLRTQTDSDAGIGDPRPWLAQASIERMTFKSHVPTQRNELGYLAATDSGEPILLNRAITDADVVLPIGCYHSRAAAGYYGVHSTVFPTFSDQRTIQRFRSPTSLDARGRPKKKPGKLVDHVGWLLGVTLTVQVIPGPGDQVLNVVAGQTAAVRRRAQQLYRAAWRSSAPRRASLVVATIEGGPVQQTWENVGRALAASGNLVKDGGAIAVCCDLADEPGPAVRRLAAARAPQEAMQWIRRERPEDALFATLLARTLERTSVYLLSRLDQSLLEELDIAPLAQAEELVRLVGRHDSCILLANAQHAMVRLEHDD